MIDCLFQDQYLQFIIMTFQFDYSTSDKIHKIPSRRKRPKVDKNDILLMMNLRWEEHCLECAAPECYNVCPLYIRRADGACARFKYGIQKNETFRGISKFGAEIHFRKWAKLEANLSQLLNSSLPEQADFENLAASKEYLNNIDKGQFTQPFDEFIIECYSLSNAPFNLLIEYFVEKDRLRTTLSKFTLSLAPGYNFFCIPFSRFKIRTIEGYLYISPEAETPEKKIVFSFLDFIKLNPKAISENEGPAPLVKCVAWDLDNTLWDGIISENDVVKLRPVSESLLKEFDNKGILQTIVSKNSYDPTMKKLEEFKINEYFLYPAINWGQKSENLKDIARKLNIDLNSFAVIDDSAFERADITTHLPQVRTYSDKEIETLNSLPEFDSPVTEMSRVRRQSYLSETKRNADAEFFSDNYEDFLRHCEMRTKLFFPTGSSDILRCWELIQRTNQLNLSSDRYTIQEFNKLLTEDKHVPIGLRCQDKYGDYGIVGFILLDMKGEVPRFKDFVLSCRVAQKKIEHTIIQAISRILQENRFKTIEASLVRTSKNGPLCKVFKDLKFETKEILENKEILMKEIDAIPEIERLMEITISSQVSGKILQITPDERYAKNRRPGSSLTT
jgi:FkbH-like protein